MAKTKQRISRQRKKEIAYETGYNDKFSKFSRTDYDDNEDIREDEYYLASMFPSDDVMHRVYSIIRKRK